MSSHPQYNPTEQQIKDIVRLMIKNYNQFDISEMLGMKEWQVQFAMKYIAENRMFNMGESKGNITHRALVKLEQDLFANIERSRNEPNNLVIKSTIADQQHRYAYALL